MGSSSAFFPSSHVLHVKTVFREDRLDDAPLVRVVFYDQNGALMRLHRPVPLSSPRSSLLPCSPPRSTLRAPQPTVSLWRDRGLCRASSWSSTARISSRCLLPSTPFPLSVTEMDATPSPAANGHDDAPLIFDCLGGVEDEVDEAYAHVFPVAVYRASPPPG